MNEIFDHLALGVSAAISPLTLGYCLFGVTLGTLVGLLPGVGILATIAMLMPLTFHLDPMVALVMLAGIYYGAAYGGSTASILLNLPGTAATAVTCLDGYPMTNQGRGGVALFMTTIASFVGSIIGIAMLAAFAAPLATAAVRFGPQENFSLMVLGLVAASCMSTTSPLKSLAMCVIGVMFGLVGMDVTTGTVRFTFGVRHLYEGISLVALALGIFGLAELMKNAGIVTSQKVRARDITMRSMLPTREDWRGPGEPCCAAPVSAPSLARFRAPEARSPPSCPTRSNGGFTAGPRSSARAPSKAWPVPRRPTTRQFRPHSFRH